MACTPQQKPFTKKYFLIEFSFVVKKNKESKLEVFNFLGNGGCDEQEISFQ
jgi:hypothetical protein